MKYELMKTEMSKRIHHMDERFTKLRSFSMEKITRWDREKA